MKGCRKIRSSRPRETLKPRYLHVQRVWQSLEAQCVLPLNGARRSYVLSVSNTLREVSGTFSIVIRIANLCIPMLASIRSSLEQNAFSSAQRGFVAPIFKSQIYAKAIVLWGNAQRPRIRKADLRALGGPCKTSVTERRRNSLGLKSSKKR